MNLRLPEDFYYRDVLEVAPELLGKTLVRRFSENSVTRFQITEVEAYRGTEDLACHASKGKTTRNKVMFEKGGKLYVYLIYGIYWMLNIVTGDDNDASAILIRGLDVISGPGKVGKLLQLDKSFYGEDLITSNRIWIEDSIQKVNFQTASRIGINYAGEPWISKHWRFILKS
jgi:DNA-3-methyladenine glycosylase